MRFQRIFWVLFCLFPNSVFADAEEAAIVAKQKEISSKLAAELKKIETLPVVPQIEPVAIKVEASAGKLMTSSEKASTMCLESTSPALIGTISKHGLTIQALGTMLQGISDQCSEVGKMIGLANAGIGAFQAQCGTFQALCSSDATTLTNSTAEYLAASQKAANLYTALEAQGDASAAAMAAASLKHSANATAMKVTVSEATALCGKYKIQVMQAATAGALALAELMKSNKCADETKAANAIDCNDKNNAFYNQKNCMCTRNELPAADCQNVLIGGGNGVSGPEIALGKSDGKLEGDGKLGELYGIQPTKPASADMPSGGGLPGAPTGGGGVGASNGGGGGAQDGKSVPRRLNTNILGGGSGGGGGGGFGSGPGYGETDPSLKAYGPGGAKDANRKIASELTKQVTNPAGRSNWEKVKSRYTDNLRNLTGR